MNKQKQLDKTYKLIKQDNDHDDEQIKKTLNYFDSILDPYINIIDENIPVHHIRRYTSEYNLNEIPLSSQSIQTSTNNVLHIPSDKTHLNLIDKTNFLISNSTSASLIDLTSIDKLSSRPHFRFVPSINENFINKENNIEQQSNIKDDKFHLKTIGSNQTSLNNQNKYTHKIIKPTVIIPIIPKFLPITRLAETHIHHENGHSAFKPHESNKKKFSLINKSNLNIGITNSNNLLHHHQQQQQKTFKSHQSMLNLSSIGTSESVNTNRINSHTSQINKLNEHHLYHIPASITCKNSISKCIQQVNNTSCINGLVNQSFPNEIRNRSHQQSNSYISTNLSIPPSMNNSDHFYRQQTYLNSVNTNKNHSLQSSNPVQSVYLASPPVSRNGMFPLSNIYHFNQTKSPREGQSKRNSHRHKTTITTYL